MSKTAEGLIEHCKDKLGTPYVYGAKGEVLTQAILDRLAAQNPKTYSDSYKQKAAKFIGRQCTDCSGLISWYTGVLRGSQNYHDHAVGQANISRLDESMIGWALWKPGHIGVYIGDGWCIEEKGIDYGTVQSRVEDTPWKKVLKLPDIVYSTTEPSPENKSGWYKENGGWRFYLGDTGNYVQNAWYQDGEDWYWFDGAGMMVADNWKTGSDGKWYYLTGSGAMAKADWIIWKKELYRLTEDGSMFEGRLRLTSDENGALQLYNLAVNDMGYVKDGLIFCLDGIYNTRDGHDGSVTTFWHDLSGNDNDPVLVTSGGGITFGDTYCNLQGGYFKINKPESGWMPMTFEIVCQTDEDVTNVGAGTSSDKPCVAGNYVDMFRIGIANDNEMYGVTALSTAILTKTSIPKVNKTSFSVVVDAMIKDAYGYGRLGAKIYANGGATTGISNNLYTYISPRICIGKGYDTQDALPWKGKIYSVRIYNRKLSQDELDYNYSIDRARFNF